MLNRSSKEKIIKEIREDIGKSQAVFVTNLIGIAANDSVEVRKLIRDSDGRIVVTKNTLLRIASQGTPAEVLFKDLKGPHAVAFAFSDVAAVAKGLKKASDLFEGLVELKGGLLQGRILNSAQLIELASLPGRDEMLATLLATFNAPVSALVRVINAIKEKKEAGQEAPTEAIVENIAVEAKEESQELKPEE